MVNAASDDVICVTSRGADDVSRQEMGLKSAPNTLTFLLVASVTTILSSARNVAPVIEHGFLSDFNLKTKDKLLDVA